MNAETGLNTGAPDGDADGTFPDQFAYLTPGGAPPGARQIGLVPGNEVPLLKVNLPRALRGHAREQVAERQMRDALASGGDVIEVRPFYRTERPDSWTRVLVSDCVLLEDWRRLAGADCRAQLAAAKHPAGIKGAHIAQKNHKKQKEHPPDAIGFHS